MLINMNSSLAVLKPEYCGILSPYYHIIAADALSARTSAGIILTLHIISGIYLAYFFIENVIRLDDFLLTKDIF